MQEGPSYDPDELAKIFGISKRTIFRDLKTLEALDIKVKFDRREDGYKISDRYTLGPALKADEAFVMEMALESLPQKSKEILGYIVNVSTIAIYFVMLSVLEIPHALQVLQFMGLILFAAGIIFIILTIATLVIKPADSVISSGVFSVVRHPMYLGAIFIFLSMACFLPHWIMVTLAVVNVIYIYWFMVVGEQKNIEKFGDDYKHYMQSVPRANLFVGFIRLLRSK